MNAVAVDILPDSPEALYQFGKGYLKHHLVKYRNPDGVTEHPLTRALDEFLNPNKFRDGYELITKHLASLVKDYQYADCPKVIKDLLFCYARAMGEDAADHDLFAIALESSSRYIQEGALLGLGQWARAGDTEAIKLLRKPMHGSTLERLRCTELRNALTEDGDNSSPAACDEIDRLLGEKADADAAVDKALSELLIEDPYKGWTNVEFPKVPSAQYIGLMRNVFGIHPTLSLGFVECFRNNGLFSMPASNLRGLTLTTEDDTAGSRVQKLDAVGQTFWLIMVNEGDREHWKIWGGVKSFPHQP